MYGCVQRDWWIIDSRTGQVVNVVQTGRATGPDLTVMRGAQHLYATLTPTREQMEEYAFYHQRP